MINKTLSINTQIDQIYHVSDVHIRNLIRHDEYKLVFNNLFDEIKKNTKNTLICVSGDIAHAKTDISPELINMMNYFFSSLADIAPTIVITGNHDCNLNNTTRLDTLSPILELMNHPNLHYLKDTGVYTVNNIDFVVFSVFDVNTIDLSQLITYCNPNHIKIALYHGLVNGATTDKGFSIDDFFINTQTFDGFDYAFLGDIHKLQVLQLQSYYDAIEIDEVDLDDYIKKGYEIIIE